MATRSYDETEFDLLREWLDANQDSASEQMIGRLEQTIAQDFPAGRVQATNSAMGALHLALQTVGVGPGTEVIVDPIVVFGGMAAMYHNSVPIFADIDRLTLNIDPESVRARITHRTKAIICTHLFGNICAMKELRAIADEHGVAIIEDCAHALYSTQDGTSAGLFGDFAAFSFNHRKQLSTGQGGFLLINGDDWVEASRDKGFGRVPDRLNWNYAMSGAVAALALAQWPRARGYVEEDHDLALLYESAVEGCEWLRPQVISPENWSAYHIWSAVFAGDDHGVDYDEFMTRLRENGADYFLPSFMPYGAFGLEPSPAYRYPIFTEPRAYTLRCPTFCPHYDGVADYGKGACPNAEEIVPRLFNTVLSPIQAERVKRYADALRTTVSEFS